MCVCRRYCKYLKEDLDKVGSNELKCNINIATLVIDNYNRKLEFAGLNESMIFYDADGNGHIIEGSDTDDLFQSQGI